jgi:hypothetical protein
MQIETVTVQVLQEYGNRLRDGLAWYLENNSGQTAGHADIFTLKETIAAAQTLALIHIASTLQRNWE